MSRRNANFGKPRTDAMWVAQRILEIRQALREYSEREARGESLLPVEIADKRSGLAVLARFEAMKAEKA